MENGRRYHAYKEGSEFVPRHRDIPVKFRALIHRHRPPAYVLPNDEVSYEELSVAYEMP